jgi:dihydroorotate dehydrogenase
MSWYALARPLIDRLDPETAHRLALKALAAGLVPGDRNADPAILRVRAMGLDFSNPVGLAAGFDKNALVYGAVKALGFGFAEIGGVTPLPQVGNPRPRLFRLEADRAAINRMGFNNDGMDAVAARLAARRDRAFPVGANLASNTESADPANDFERLVARFAPIADYLTIDVSCPNTKNGRLFQDPARLTDLLARLKVARGAAATPMLVKLASDLGTDEARAIARVTADAGLAGLVVANTSAARPDSLLSPAKAERGGLSGRPIFEASTRLLAEVRAEVGPDLVLIGVGGIFTGADVLAKMRAGANLVQLYTALVYEGPPVVARIKRELAELLRQG